VTRVLRRWFPRSAAITRRAADRLLDRQPAGAANDDVARLLAAAAGPARPGELAGEREAVAAFRREFGRETRTGVAVAPRPARRPRRRVAAVAALSALLLAVGGTAYAASTGRLPDAVERVVEGMFTGGDPAATPPSDPASPNGSTDAAPSPTGPASGATSPAAPGGAAPGVDVARLTGLCRSWEATRGNPNSNSISAEDLRVLATAAGGEDRIEAYCAALLNRPAQPRKSDKPGNPNPGGGRPTAPPGGGPTKGRKG
jgi:hypothetical protein